MNRDKFRKGKAFPQSVWTLTGGVVLATADGHSQRKCRVNPGIHISSGSTGKFETILASPDMQQYYKAANERSRLVIPRLAVQTLATPVAAQPAIFACPPCPKCWSVKPE